MFNRKLFLWSLTKRLWEYDGPKLALSGKEVGLFTKTKNFKDRKELTLNNQTYTIKGRNQKDFILEHVPNQYNIPTSDYNYLVVPDLQVFLDQHPNSSIFNQYYGGMNVTASEEEATQTYNDYSKFLDDFNRESSKEGSLFTEAI